MATNGLVTCWGPFMSGETMVFQGLAEKILSISKAGTPHMSSWGNDWVRLDPEYMKRAFDTLLLDAGVTVLSILIYPLFKCSMTAWLKRCWWRIKQD